MKVPSVLFDDTAPSASLDHRKAQAAPIHPRAPPEHLGGSPWPQQAASGRPKLEVSPPFNRQECKTKAQTDLLSGAQYARWRFHDTLPVARRLLPAGAARWGDGPSAPASRRRPLCLRGPPGGSGCSQDRGAVLAAARRCRTPARVGSEHAHVPRSLRPLSPWRGQAPRRAVTPCPPCSPRPRAATP